MQANMGAAQKFSLKTRRYIFYCFFGGGFVSCMYAIRSNHIPSQIVVRYGPLVWVTLALAFFVFMVWKCSVRSPFAYDPRAPRWKRISGTLLFLVAALFVAKATATAVFPALFNRIAGDRFQAKTAVPGKSWDVKSGFKLKLAIGETFVGGFFVSKSVWKQIRNGDVVTVSGLQSALGRTIDTVTKP